MNSLLPTLSNNNTMLDNLRKKILESYPRQKQKTKQHYVSPSLFYDEFYFAAHQKYLVLQVLAVIDLAYYIQSVMSYQALKELFNRCQS